MATDIIASLASLFGVTPEMYQQRQAAQADERALQYAQLTPFQQANYAISRGAYGLAGALGGALGAQDPQLQLISQRNAIARQIDPTNLKSMRTGIRALVQAGDQVGAMQLSQILQQRENDIALRSQREAAAGASLAQAAKSQAEIDEIDRQQRAFALLTGAKPAEAAAPAAAVPEAAVPAAAVPGAQPLYSINEQSLAGLPDDVQNSIQAKLEDAARLRADTTDPQSSRASLRRSQAALLEEQATRLLVANRPGMEITGGPDRDAIAQQKFNTPSYYALGENQKAAVDREFDLARDKALLAQAKQSLGFQFAPTAAAAAPAAAAPAAAPAAAASTRASISRQIAELENRRGQMLALTRVPAAKAEADLLGDRIKDLREQLKPTEIAKLEREIDQFRADGASDTDPRIKTRLDKIVKLSTPTSERFGTDREAVSLEVYDKPFSQLTQAQRAAVNKRVEEEQAKKAPRITVDVRQQEAFAQGRGKSQSDLLTEATSSARGAAQALTGITSMKQLNDSGQLFTGPLANPAVGASNLLASIGLLSADQVARLTKSEVYDKLAKDLVMQDLGGKLGAQISDADRKFVEARIPQLTTSVKARTELLDKLAEIQRGKITYYEKMNAHANQFNNLNTFDFSQMYAPVSPSGGWSIKKMEPNK